MGKKLKEIGIEPYKSNDKLKIKVSAEALQELAKSHNWIHETDEYYDAESKTQKPDLPDPNGLDAGIPCEEVDSDEVGRRLSDKEKECNELKEEYERMRLELEELRKLKTESTVKPPADLKHYHLRVTLVNEGGNYTASRRLEQIAIAKEFDTKFKKYITKAVYSQNYAYIENGNKKLSHLHGHITYNQRFNEEVLGKIENYLKEKYDLNYHGCLNSDHTEKYVQNLRVVDLNDQPKEESPKAKSVISLIDDSDGEGENIDTSENKIMKAIQAK